jgi:hypothetical protein
MSGGNGRLERRINDSRGLNDRVNFVVHRAVRIGVRLTDWSLLKLQRASPPTQYNPRHYDRRSRMGQT